VSEQHEVRLYWRAELMCPNPVEYYKATRVLSPYSTETTLLYWSKGLTAPIEEKMMAEAPISSPYRPRIFYPFWLIPIFALLFLLFK